MVRRKVEGRGIGRKDDRLARSREIEGRGKVGLSVADLSIVG